MVFLLWPLNFAISWFNAWAVGSTWDSTRARSQAGMGGEAHFMNWMGAIMSASGFTWCYLVVLGLLGSVTPMSLLVSPEKDAPPVTGMLLDPSALQAFYDLGYLVIVLPILGSGLAITVQTWRAFARAKQRRAGDYAITGWNTFAQVHNTYTAVREIPGVLSRLGDFFGGKKSGDNDNKSPLLVLLLVVLAASAGILTTYSIIQARRRAVVLDAYRETLEREAA